MSDVSRDDSGGDTFDLTRDDDDSEHAAQNSDQHNGSPHAFSDHEGGGKEEITPTKSSRASTKETDPVKVLQLSQQFYVPDTMEDEDEDVSMMIPPTPSERGAPYIIPSTPPGADDSSIMEEGPAATEGKDLEAEKQSHFDEADEDLWNKPTQPLSPTKQEVEESIGEQSGDDDETFADTDALLSNYCDAPTQPNSQSMAKGKSDGHGNSEKEDDDDWNLRLTASQATQSLETLPIDVPYEEETEKEKHFSPGRDERRLQETTEDQPSNHKEDRESCKEKRGDDVSPKEEDLDKTIHEVVDSSDEDEIEPSQTPSSKSMDVSREAVQEATTPKSRNERESEQGAAQAEEAQKENVEIMDVSEAEPVAKLSQEKESSPQQQVTPGSASPHKNDTLQAVPKVPERTEDSETQNLPEIVLYSSKESESGTSNKSSSSEVEPAGSNAQMLPPATVHRRHLRWSHTPHRKTAGARISDMASRLDYRSDDDKEVPNADKSELKLNIFSHPKRALGSYTDHEDLGKLLKSVGVNINSEKLKSLISSPKRSAERVILKKNVVYQIVERDAVVYEEFLVANEEEGFLPHLIHQYSPIDSSSTTTSTKTSSFVSTPSGEMGDISSSASSKSASSNMSAAHGEGRTQGTQTALSQASLDTTGIKTSTQTENAMPLDNISLFKMGAIMSESKMSSQDDFQNPVVMLSPLKSPKKRGRKSPDALDTGSSTSKPRQTKNTRKQAVKRAIISESSDSDMKPQSKKAARADSGKGSPASKRSPAKKALPETKRRGARKKVESAPKKEEEELPQTSEKPVLPIPIIEEDSSSNPAPFGNILPGVRVMARWRDGYYYSGVVLAEEADGRWRVQFDDEATRVVSRENLLKISMLQAGTNVMAQSPDGYYDPGIISSHYREAGEVGYVVEHESGVTQRYPRRCVILSTEQAKMITDTRPMAPVSLTINLDNIVDGKRKRKSSQQTPEADTAASPKFARKSQRRKHADANLDTTESSANETAIPERVLVDKVKNELSSRANAQKQASEKKTKGKKGGRKVALKEKREIDSSNEDLSSNATDEKEEKSTDKTGTASTAGDQVIPVRSTRLFQGCAFLLSHAFRKNAESENILGEDVKSDNVRPFDKEHLCRLIVAGGGTVLETFEEAQKCGKKKIFLLANTYLRTIKYIQCVAANIPCIQHYWAQICSLTGRFLHHTPYLLPTGYSLIKNDTIPWHSKTDIFKDLKIVVTAEKDSEFVNIWTPVLLAAKADLVQKWALPSFSVPGHTFLVSVIVTNATCPSSVLTAARKRKIPVVSSEWVIQCIIAGEKLPFDAHPKFKHDYQE